MTGAKRDPGPARSNSEGSEPVLDQVRAAFASGTPTPDGVVLPIVRAGHPVLGKAAALWTGQLDADTMTRLIAAMRATMRAAPGVGLAAPQIGVSLALAVIEDPGMVASDVAAVRERRPYGFRVLINPRYEPHEPDQVAWPEGCLSIPGCQATRARWRSVRLTGWDDEGRALDEVVTGWPARIVQHETDHLSGRLYLDDAVPGTLVVTEPGP